MKTALDGQFGFAAESTFGTFVAPARFLEIMPGESMKLKRGKYQKQTIGGLMNRTDGMRMFTQGADGGIAFEVATKGFGLLFKQCFGSGSIAQVGSTTEWKQTFIPDLTSGGAGVSASLQLGRPSTNGTVNAFSYVGSKVTEFEFVAELEKALMLSTTWDSQNEDVGQTLGTQTLPSGSVPLIFIDGALTIDAGAASVKGLKIKGVRALDTERRYLGAITTKKEQLANGKMIITGELGLEFESMTEYNKFVAGTLSALVATFSYGTITGAATPYKAVFTLPNIIYTGDSPTLADTGVLQLPLPFEALWDGSAAAWTLEYHSSDVAL